MGLKSMLVFSRISTLPPTIAVAQYRSFQTRGVRVVGTTWRIKTHFFSARHVSPAHLCGDGGVGHSRGHGDEAVDAAEAHGDLEQLRHLVKATKTRMKRHRYIKTSIRRHGTWREINGKKTNGQFRETHTILHPATRAFKASTATTRLEEKEQLLNGARIHPSRVE